MMVFNFTADEVLEVQETEGCSLAEAVSILKRHELLEEIHQAKENKDPGRLADVLGYVVGMLL